MNLNKTFTKEEQKIHETLVEYDKVRKSEGYSIAYRRWVVYQSLFGDNLPGKHCETMYMHTSGKALLVKVMLDGSVSAFESVQ